MSITKQIDSKGRVLLGSEFAGATFLMETQKDGSLILRPAITVAVEIAWFYKNKKAQESVRRGLEQAKHGKLKKMNITADLKLIEQMEDGE